MLIQLREGCQSELICAIMASLTSAGGEHITITEVSHTHTGQLKGKSQRDAFCAALRDYKNGERLYHGENEVLRLDIIAHLEEHQPDNVLIFKWGDETFIFDADGSVSIADVLDARDQAAKAMEQLYMVAVKLGMTRPRSGNTLGEAPTRGRDPNWSASDLPAPGIRLP